MRKILAGLLVALAATLGLALVPSAAGATPVSCGWWQSHTPTIVYQCVRDGNHYLVNEHKDIGGGQIQVTLVVNYWNGGWTTWEMTHGNFAGTVAAHINLCTAPKNGWIPSFANLAAHQGGWEHTIENIWWNVAQQRWEYWYEGSLNHFHGWAGVQAFGGELQAQQNCNAWGGLGTKLTLG